MPDSRRDEQEQKWVSGRVRESADGMKERKAEPSAAQEARLREAMKREKETERPRRGR
jgi:hypothetical protein